MLESVRMALRLKTDKFDSEINSLIAACLADLGLGGLQNYSDTDPLILQAVILYCKSHFGFDDDSDKYNSMYEALKIAIANSEKYGDGAD